MIPFPSSHPTQRTWRLNEVHGNMLNPGTSRAGTTIRGPAVAAAPVPSSCLGGYVRKTWNGKEWASRQKRKKKLFTRDDGNFIFTLTSLHIHTHTYTHTHTLSLNPFLSLAPSNFMLYLF